VARELAALRTQAQMALARNLRWPPPQHDVDDRATASMRLPGATAWLFTETLAPCLRPGAAVRGRAVLREQPISSRHRPMTPSPRCGPVIPLQWAAAGSGWPARWSALYRPATRGRAHGPLPSDRAGRHERLEMVTARRDPVERGLALKKAGNAIMGRWASGPSNRSTCAPAASAGPGPGRAHCPYRVAEAGRCGADRRCEQAIRDYDPCISCSAHFVDLTVGRS